MKKIIISLLLGANCFAQSFEDYKSFVSKYEGNKNTVYIDRHGNKTVGIGHLLPKDSEIKTYSAQQIDEFFLNDYNRTFGFIREIYPDFNLLPYDVKLVLFSLGFNLGRSGLIKFYKFNRAVNNCDWRRAAAELQDSVWYHQVGRRGKEHVEVFTKL